MEALNDPILNRDKEHTIEPIFEDTADNSLPLDHTADIIQDIPEQSTIPLAQAQLLSELEFTTTERSTMFMGNGFSYTEHIIKGNNG